MLTTYGYTVRWKDFDGTLHTVKIIEMRSMEDAKRYAFECAKKQGYTPRKWWQWWRWDENVNYETHAHTHLLGLFFAILSTISMIEIIFIVVGEK